MRDVKKIIPIREQIAEQIRSDIIGGDLAPNEKLNEQSLAARFGVSRGPIRDVLLQLSKEGLLVIRNNCGASVNSVLDHDSQQLMIDIRSRIETFAVKKLKGQMTEDDFSALDDILQRLKNAFNDHDFTTVTKTDIEFHRYLVYKAGGDELVNLWHPIIMRMRLNYKRITQTKECVNEHKAIITALRDNNTRSAIAALKANIR